MKFSIRDLLLVTVIVALATGWIVDHLSLRKEIEELRKPVIDISKTILEKLNAEKKAGKLRGFDITFTVDAEGTVWLSGPVSSEEQRTTAINVALRVKGVTMVVSDFTGEKANPAP